MAIVEIPHHEHQFEVSSVLNTNRAYRLFTYFLKCIEYGDLPGNVAEFGVYLGETSREMCKYLNLINSQRKMLLFDTFTGLPNVSQYYTIPGCYIGSKDTVLETMKDVSNFEIYEGLIENYISLDSFDGMLCFAHIDCDAYEGTRDSITICDKRMLASSYIVVDDYQTAWVGVTKACEEQIFNRPDKWEVTYAEQGQLVARKVSNL